MMVLTYLRLELKRAWKRFPQVCGGTALLLVLAAVTALAASRVLYGSQVTGRVAVGVSLPGDDALAKQVMNMVGSLDSVESICDFQYMDREACLKKLEQGELYAVLDIPEGFVEDIINGTNTPVKVWLTKNAGVEGRLFRELADAGALTLSASQAGIYGGNELYRALGLDQAIGQLEEELNRRYLDYSLERSRYFRHLQVEASGDVTTAEFYQVSMYVLFLFLTAIPASGYLMPPKRAMRQKLTAQGIGPVCRTGARIMGLGTLMAFASGPVALLALLSGQTGGMAVLGAVWTLSAVTVSAVTVLLYQLAGSLLGGVMLLFLVSTGQHFLAGGFLPSVFFPETLQKIGPWLPSGILMETVKMAVTGAWSWRSAAVCAGLAATAWILSAAAEVRRL